MSYLDLLPPVLKRREDRVPVDAMCNELVHERKLIGLLVDASETGLRIQRVPRRLIQPDRRVQLEFELPDTGESIWALGELCHDQLAPAQSSPTLIRTSGVQILRAASRHMRMLRDWVHDRRGRRPPQKAADPPVATRDGDDHWLLRTAAFARG